MTMPTIVYIAGLGHSGSTIFDLALGGHSAIAGLGEVHRLSIASGRDDSPMRCSCDHPVGLCSFWVKVALELGARSSRRRDVDTTLAALSTTDPQLALLRGDGVYPEHGQDTTCRPTVDRALAIVGSRRLLKAASRWSSSARTASANAVNSYEVFDAVRRAHRVAVILDATKTPSRLKGLLMERPQDVDLRVIYIVRDGRAVCASRMRREGVPMAQSVATWKAEHRRHRLARLTISSNRLTTVRYEEFATHPERVLAGVCAWLGVPFEEGMLDLNGERHSIGGNPVRFDSSRLSDVRLDERWRHELSAEDLRTFSDHGTTLNRRLGYVD